MRKYNDIHPDLLAVQKLVFEPIGLKCSKLTQEEENQQYGACMFEMNHKIIKFRAAKITPTKNGQFVTFWKRIGQGPIMPYDITDSIDLFIVSVRNAQYLGLFVFPKEILCQNGFVSKEKKGGKRAMRVYPPWDIAESPQAKKTQSWQLRYFCEIQHTINIDHVQRLFN